MQTTTRLWTWTRWAPLLALTATLAACGAAVAPDPAATPDPAPADRQATCVDSAIRLPGLGPRVHGAIVSDTLHMGGATAPATCTEPANQSLAAGLPPILAGRTEQAQQAQSRYYLIVINYPGGNRLYVVSRRPDGTSCVVDTNDQCIAQVTDLPDDFDLQDLPEDVRPTIPAGRPAPPTVSPPPAVEPPPNGYTPPAVSPPPPAAGTPPGTAGAPQPSNGATGVAVGGPLLSWAYAPRALSYDVYWGMTKELAADTERGTPINTSSTFVTIAASASLAHETLYYWRVDAKNEAGTTRGAVWSFTTAAAPAPEPKTKIWTISETRLSDFSLSDFRLRAAIRPPKFVWDEITEANRACVRVSIGGHPTPFSSSRSRTSGIRYDHSRTWTVDAEVSVGAITLVLTAPDLYRCGLYGSACSGSGMWGNLDSARGALKDQFLHANIVTRCTTADAPAARPAPAYNPQPRDGATGVALEAQLSWSAPARATSYEVRWGAARHHLFNSISTTSPAATIRSVKIGRPGQAHEVRPLEPGKTYYWRVYAENSVDDTRGNEWSFTTAYQTAPAAATNPQPRDEATGVAVETVLRWSAADRAASYEVYWGTTESLAADADLGTPIATRAPAASIRRPGTTAAERRLALGTTYFWRVDTKNARGTTTGSVWSFTTENQAAPPSPGGGG